MSQPPSVVPSLAAWRRPRVDVHGLVAQVTAAITPPQSRGPMAFTGPDVVAARLDALRGPLRAHFDESERAGLFEHIEERAPEQAELCRKLRREHPSLLQHLDRLRGAHPIDRRGVWWGRDVRTFLDELARHEARETDLVDSVLGGSGHY